MYLVKKNFSGNGVGKVIGEFLTKEEEAITSKLNLEKKGLVEKFSGKDGDDEHLNALNLAELRALLHKRIPKFNHSGKSEEALRAIYRESQGKSSEKAEKPLKSSKKASKKAAKKVSK